MTKRFIILSLVLLGLVQFSFGQKTVVPNKQKLVLQLVETVNQLFPFSQYEDGFQQAREVIKAVFEIRISEQLDQKVDSTENLSETERSELKSKIPESAAKYAVFINSLISKDFKMKSWVNESASKHLNKKYSVAELKKLNKFMQSPEGRKTILAMKNFFGKEFHGKNPETNPEKAAEFEKTAKKFAETPMGTKFLSIIVENILTDVQKSIDNWESPIFGNFDSLVKPQEFNKFLSDFIKQAQKS